MTTNRSRKIWISLPVKDLKRSIEFFTRLGFSFNPQFTDEKAACVILSEEAYVMLLVEEFFSTLHNKKICDTATAAEALFALSADSRAEVDEMLKTALEAGGKPAEPTMDYGFMYQSSFYDPDGHGWAINYMDPAAAKR